MQNYEQKLAEEELLKIRVISSVIYKYSAYFKIQPKIIEEAINHAKDNKNGIVNWEQIIKKVLQKNDYDYLSLLAKERNEVRQVFPYNKF